MLFCVCCQFSSSFSSCFLSYHGLSDLHHFSSIGNFFFAGARIFFQSLDAAIFLFSRVSDIPSESLVLPVISTNDRLTLGCELWVLLPVYVSMGVWCMQHKLWGKKVRQVLFYGVEGQKVLSYFLQAITSFSNFCSKTILENLPFT